ncbi:ABC transporter substrate-binding protein [Profundibacter sp.]
MRKSLKGLFMGLSTVMLAGASSAEEYIQVGNLVDFTGSSSTVGKPYGQGKIDAMNWINENGGINGMLLDFETVDASYVVPRAIATYKKWVTRKQVVFIQGWGTSDTEALISFVTRDEIPYMSASYSGHLTDPMGLGPDTERGAPYNFFFGPSYSDGSRALIQWAARDWAENGGEGQPKYVFMGDNHPFPNAPRAASLAYAEELGFEVLPDIQYSLAPGDFKAQCLTLNESGANYAFLANTSGSSISLLNSCDTVGVDVQFMSNIWGYGEDVMAASGTAADGVVWVMGAAKWGDDVPGMETVRAVSAMSDPSGEQYRAVHYIRGVCSVFFMKEAMEWAVENGGLTGPNIKEGFYQRQDWVPAGMEGVCPRATWTAEDHRGNTLVFIYRGEVTGDTSGSNIGDLMADGIIGMTKVGESDIPRRPEWLGQ